MNMKESRPFSFICLVFPIRAYRSVNGFVCIATSVVFVVSCNQIHNPNKLIENSVQMTLELYDDIFIHIKATKPSQAILKPLEMLIINIRMEEVDDIDLESRKILGPAGNRVKVKNDETMKNKNNKDNVVPKKPKTPVTVKLAKKPPQVVVKKKDVSVDNLKSCSSNGSSVKVPSFKKREKRDGKSLKLERDEAEVIVFSGPVKRCDWITQFSDPLHVSFHDEEWGVPVHDDNKLFELLVLSQASAELTWPEILYKRDKFRNLFENFSPSSVAKLPEDRLLSARPNGSLLLSEQKLRAIVGNADALLKIQQEFGSFSYYCWRFLNNKPLKNGFRYARQVPAKTPKAELISKDLMKRGFRCVGPTVIYSFMQVSGMVNDHLISCFRYSECNSIVKKDLKPVAKEANQKTNFLDESKRSDE
ncbi:methyladenine glycosylase [Artemisia annua]|uniref:Methyladenine glycosylase n=1 Tax=Artemisia annua TaxID=35608 RepID=A0A2U1Q417_ARTAN|nr:methyladenine glycosylase [Artemisia annua]